MMNKEQLLKDARTIEAMKKGYMGLEGKIAIIAKLLGDPIIGQGSRFIDQGFSNNLFDNFEEFEIPTFDEDDNSYIHGLQFDGLSRGINLSIYLDNYTREIICRYEGKVVYKESSGELEGFVPNEIWENKIEEFFDAAKILERKSKIDQREQIKKKTEKKRKEIFEYFKEKWGLDN